MATPITIVARAWTAAAPSTVYDLVADGATWPSWTPIGSFRLEREGDAGGQTPGAIRVFRIAIGSSREQIVELRPGEQVSYRVLSGLPVRAHRADVVLTPSQGGTAIVWQETFEPKIPGTGPALRVLLTWFVRRFADGLAAHAARTTPTG